jgi:predicted phosphate transport protein (TIGR00153 family)
MADKNPGWFSKVFEPQTDFYKILIDQATMTLHGLEALECWINDGADERCQTVRNFESKADEIKLDLQKRLVDSFVTPFDREDIYDLSTRLDEIINSAKGTAREIEAFTMNPEDAYMTEMARTLVEGARCLVNAFTTLREKNFSEAEVQASLARKSENRLSKVYRQAMRELFSINDLKKIMRTVEVYRSFVVAAEHIDRVGAKLQHVIVKIS